LESKMSKSPGDKKVAGTLRVPSPSTPLPSGQGGDDPVANQIEAEIADHLATSAEQLEAQGAHSDDARRISQEKFGDPAAIGRRCYWIKQGDYLMFRTAVILLLTVVCLVLALAVFSSWRSQRQTAEQMVMLAEQLKAIAEQQRTASTTGASPEPKPLEITGNVFVGTPDKPAANTEVMICRVSDGEVIRRLTTASDGTFQSGPLTAGDYTLLAKVARLPWGAFGLQTTPIYVYPGGVPNSHATIDIVYSSGRIGAKLSRPLPKLKVDGKYIIESRLYVAAMSSSAQLSRWTAARPTPDRWPIYIEDPESALSDPRDPSMYLRKAHSVLANEDFNESPAIEFGGLSQLPAGSWSVVAAVVADVIPEGIDLDKTAWRPWMGQNWVLFGTMGDLWNRKLNPTDVRTEKIRFSLQAINPGWVLTTNVNVLDGQLTLLEVEVPDDVESRIQQLVETVTDPAEYVQIVNKEGPFIRPAKVTVLGTEPLKDDEASKPASSKKTP
jgi:type II secretory pathway pseudopilin PulG